MSNNLQNALSSLLSINANLWNKLSGIIENGYLYKNDTASNLDKIISTGADNWLDYNSTSKTLEVKIPIASKTNAGLVKAGDGISVASDGTISVVAEGVKMDEAGTADVAKSTSGTLTIGTQTFNGSVDVTVDLSNTIELRAADSIPTSYTGYTHPTLVYTPNGQTAIITPTGIIPTSEEITDEITASAAKKITTAKAVSAYVDDKIANAASKVSISSTTSDEGTRLSWTIDGTTDTLLIEREKWLNNVTYIPSSQMIKFEVEGGNTFDIPVSSFIKEYQAGSGIAFNTSTATFYLQKDNNTDSKFLQVGADTIGLSGITDAISNAMSSAIELKYESDIPTSVSNYTRPTLVFTNDGETAIVYPEGNTVISTSEKTVDSIEEDTPSSYIITVGAFKEYLDNEFADLLDAANALNAEIKK